MNFTKSSRFYHRPEPLSKVIPKLVAPLMKKNGFPDVNIFSDWPKIVGESLARHTLPLKIVIARSPKGSDGPPKPGMLHIKASPSVALELQHSYVQIVERVNGYFGYAAISKIKIIQSPGFRRSPKPKHPSLRPLTPMETSQLLDATDIIQNPDLKKALQSLGACLLGADPQTLPQDS